MDWRGIISRAQCWPRVLTIRRSLCMTLANSLPYQCDKSILMSCLRMWNGRIIIRTCCVQLHRISWYRFMIWGRTVTSHPYLKSLTMGKYTLWTLTDSHKTFFYLLERMGIFICGMWGTWVRSLAPLLGIMRMWRQCNGRRSSRPVSYHRPRTVKS